MGWGRGGLGVDPDVVPVWTSLVRKGLSSNNALRLTTFDICELFCLLFG